MTIDERLDRLTARHEALTETVEHLAQQGEEQNKRTRDLAATSERHEREIERFRRALRAALEAWLGDNGTEPHS